MGSALSVTPSLRHSKEWEIPQEKRTGPQLEEESSHRTFGVGAREPQLLDLRGPRHGRQHLEGVLAVDLLAVINVELQQSPKHLEVLELACMRQRGREVEKSVGSMHALSGASREFEYRSPVRKIQNLVYFLRTENSTGKADWSQL